MLNNGFLPLFFLFGLGGNVLTSRFTVTFISAASLETARCPGVISRTAPPRLLRLYWGVGISAASCQDDSRSPAPSPEKWHSRPCEVEAGFKTASLVLQLQSPHSSLPAVRLCSLTQSQVAPPTWTQAEQRLVGERLTDTSKNITTGAMAEQSLWDIRVSWRLSKQSISQCSDSLTP